MFLFSESEEEKVSLLSASKSAKLSDSSFDESSSLSRELDEIPTDSEATSTSSEEGIKSPNSKSERNESGQEGAELAVEMEQQNILEGLLEEPEIHCVLNMDKNISEIDDLMVRYLKHDRDIYSDSNAPRSEHMFQACAESVTSYQSEHRSKKRVKRERHLRKSHMSKQSLFPRMSETPGCEKRSRSFPEISEISDDWNTLSLSGEWIFKRGSKVSQGIVAVAFPHSSSQTEEGMDCVSMSNLRGWVLFFDLKNDKKSWIDVSGQNQRCKKFGLHNDLVTSMQFSIDNSLLICGFFSGSVVMFKVVDSQGKLSLEEYNSIEYKQLTKNPVSHVYIHHLASTKFLVRDFFNSICECQFADFIFYSSKVRRLNFCHFKHTFLDIVEVDCGSKILDWVFLSVDENSNLNLGSFSQQKLFHQDIFLHDVREVRDLHFSRRFFKSFDAIHVAVLVHTRVLLFRVLPQDPEEPGASSCSFALSEPRLFDFDLKNLQINVWLTNSIYLVKDRASRDLYMLNFPIIDPTSSQETRQIAERKR